MCFFNNGMVLIKIAWILHSLKLSGADFSTVFFFNFRVSLMLSSNFKLPNRINNLPSRNFLEERRTILNRRFKKNTHQRHSRSLLHISHLDCHYCAAAEAQQTGAGAGGWPGTPSSYLEPNGAGRETWEWSTTIWGSSRRRTDVAGSTTTGVPSGSTGPARSMGCSTGGPTLWCTVGAMKGKFLGRMMLSRGLFHFF